MGFRVSTITWSFSRDFLSSAVLLGPFFFRFVVRRVVVPPPPPVAAPGSGSSSSSTTVRVMGIESCMVES